MNIRLGFFPYNAMNYKAAQAWLDRRAARGWALKRVWLGCAAVLQRAESPRHFVDLDVQSGDCDSGYLQLCADAGWDLVQNVRGMLLFRAAPGRSPVPIQTDGELEWERFWEKYRPRIWLPLLTLLSVGAAVLLLTISLRQKNIPAMLAANLGLLYLLYIVLAVVHSLAQWLHSRWYLARCRRTSRVEDPGPAATVLDCAEWLQKPLLCLILFCILAEPLGFRKTVDLAWYTPSDTYTATVEACREWPVVMAVDLGLPNSGYSRRLDGFGSILVDFLEYTELAVGDEPDDFYILTTERYECVTEGLAGWVLDLRRAERSSSFLAGRLEWEPAPGLGFDECYACRDNSYLLFRQGRTVVLTGCSGMDLTTAEHLASIRERVLASP